MTKNNSYLYRDENHKGDQFKKVNDKIETCLKLIERLLKFNEQCRIEVNNKLKIENYIIDYRELQFGFFENTLKSIYYSCYSLKYVHDIGKYMNFKGINNSIESTLENQRAYITFNAIVKLSSMFEYSRKEFEKKTNGVHYFEKLREKYSADKVDSLILLNNFRNTIHSNGKWNPKNNTDNLKYKLREGLQIIKPGETFKYDHWKIYRIIKDCLELNKTMALDNEELRIRDTKIELPGHEIVVLKTDISIKDWDNLFNSSC